MVENRKNGEYTPTHLNVEFIPTLHSNETGYGWVVIEYAGNHESVHRVNKLPVHFAALAKKEAKMPLNAEEVARLGVQRERGLARTFKGFSSIYPRLWNVLVEKELEKARIDSALADIARDQQRDREPGEDLAIGISAVVEVRNQEMAWQVDHVGSNQRAYLYSKAFDGLAGILHGTMPDIDPSILCD